MPAGKDELRAGCTASRRARSAADREAGRAAVCRLVLERCRDAGWACVAAYVPLGSEPGSEQLLDGLVSLGVRVLVPVTRPDRDLDWTTWPVATAAGPLGRSAISTADAVLVPALAVAVDGVRLGRGGGSYDRALARCAAGVPIAALLFDGELVDALPSQSWDRPVGAVVAPSGWHTLPGNTAVEPSG